MPKTAADFLQKMQPTKVGSRKQEKDKTYIGDYVSPAVRNLIAEDMQLDLSCKNTDIAKVLFSCYCKAHPALMQKISALAEAEIAEAGEMPTRSNVPARD